MRVNELRRHVEPISYTAFSNSLSERKHRLENSHSTSSVDKGTFDNLFEAELSKESE